MIGPLLGTFRAEARDGIRRVKLHTAITAENVADEYNVTREEMDAYSDALSELGFKYNVQHDIWMMPVVKNQQHFYHWAASYPFYSNVQKEGVVLYEAA